MEFKIDSQDLQGVFRFRHYNIQNIQLDDGCKLRDFIVNSLKQKIPIWIILRNLNRLVEQRGINVDISLREISIIKHRLIRLGVVEDKNEILDN